MTAKTLRVAGFIRGNYSVTGWSLPEKENRKAATGSRLF